MFCLKWNDFHSNVSNSFGLLRNEQYLQDVKLVTDDQQIILAHKLVLSVSSDYFQNIFQNNDDSKLVLCLEGVSKNDLNKCIDYMYYGEVQIYQNDLDRFLNAAQRFKIKGLLTDNIDNETSEGKTIIDHTNTDTIDDKLYFKDNDLINSNLEKMLPRQNKIVAQVNESSYDMKSETEKYIERLDNGNNPIKRYTHFKFL